MKYFPEGVCYTAQQCEDLHGEAMGGCARGFGTCCVFRYNGAERNKEEVLGSKISYIENPTNSMRSMKQDVDIKASNKGGINLKKPTWTFVERLILAPPIPPYPISSGRFSE